jgi:D-alanine-D-alanine ligase
MPDRLHVGLLYGGLSPEHDVSVRSARAVAGALDAGYRVTPIWISREGRWHVQDGLAALQGETDDAGTPALLSPFGAGGAVLVDGQPLGLDVVVPMLHGVNGEDGSVQGFLQTLGLPYVGPDVLASAVCMDKETAKRVLRDAGLPVVPFLLAHDGLAYAEAASELGPTLFVKPANSGSSVGTSKVETEAEWAAAVAAARRYDRKVLVETAVAGREIECAVLGNEDPEASVPGEVVSTAQFYTYDAKYEDPDASRMEVPASLPDAVAERVRQLAVAAYRALDCEGMARVDCFVADDGDLFVNEVNTIPGFTDRSMYPVMWAHGGLDLGALVGRLIDLALERHRRDAALQTTR